MKSNKLQDNIIIIHRYQLQNNPQFPCSVFKDRFTHLIRWEPYLSEIIRLATYKRNIDGKEESIMNNEEMVTKTGFEILNEVENATCHLEALPNIIQLLIDNLKLEKINPTSEELQDLALCRDTIRDVLFIVQHSIWEATDGINAIELKKVKED